MKKPPENPKLMSVTDDRFVIPEEYIQPTQPTRLSYRTLVSICAVMGVAIGFAAYGLSSIMVKPKTKAAAQVNKLQGEKVRRDNVGENLGYLMAIKDLQRCVQQNTTSIVSEGEALRRCGDDLFEKKLNETVPPESEATTE